jgi:predicted O-linked N-acetylglucosamine transferase (SPINDLY family)
MDYIMSDAVVAPDPAFYSEAIVNLPGSFFPAGPDRALPPPPSRNQAGLPDTGIVFCCFNQNWKITERVFDVWMRLLAAVEGSVLWLADCPDEPRRKLEQAAEARGIQASRLIWAQRASFNAHLARLQLADMVLDTLPYNAHATAADALLCGVPVVTCRGASFAGRVAASLLEAAGLDELVTSSLGVYEALALRLARDPDALAAARQTLARNRDRLFDLGARTRALEAAYRHMRRAADQKTAPAGFTVSADGAII